MPLVNVHYHLGAEHKSEAYMDSQYADAWDAANSRRLEQIENLTQRTQRRLTSTVRPGYFCDATYLDQYQSAPYSFQYCKGDVQVGKTYEVQYVHSSAGYSQAELNANSDLDQMDDGLGGAANGKGMLNPMIAIQSAVFMIVQGAATNDDLLHDWSVTNHVNTVMYMGSTTGPSHNNQVCSPYSVTWHVDTMCHQIAPESFDKLCKDMKDLYNLNYDLYPHGSREIVDSAYVVPESEVEAYS